MKEHGTQRNGIFINSEKANMRQVKVIISGKGKCTSASAPVRSGIYEMTAIFEDNSIYLTD